MGPRSQEGKAQSRLNSRKHGLTATMLVTGYEDARQFEELRDELIAEHDPQSALECELVERLAGIIWRQRRAPVFEAAILDACQAEAGPIVCRQFLANRGQEAGERGETAKSLTRSRFRWEKVLSAKVAAGLMHSESSLATKPF